MWHKLPRIVLKNTVSLMYSHCSRIQYVQYVEDQSIYPTKLGEISSILWYEEGSVLSYGMRKDQFYPTVWYEVGSVQSYGMRRDLFYPTV